jgi:hypothetical protein
MPIATIDPAQSERFYLKTLPSETENPDDGGWVDLRPLPYGMKLTQRDKSIRQTMEMQAPKRGQKPDNSIKAEMETASEWSNWYEMSYCIVDHNLTSADGAKLDFTSQMTFKSLNPKVGSEIESLLFDLNRDEDEESLEDFHKRSTTSSEAETSMSSRGSTSQEDGTDSPSKKRDLSSVR